MARYLKDPQRVERVREDLPEAIHNMVTAWSSLAENAASIAHARREIFLAYVAEGFTEAQALELVKTV